MQTGIVFDPIFLEHHLPGHPEGRERLEHILTVLNTLALPPRLVPLSPEPITLERLCRVHILAYVDQVRETAEHGWPGLDEETYVVRRSYDAARMAAGGLVRATQSVVHGEVDNAFALIRPPGHHAFPDHGEGFCLFNNIAIAAKTALAEFGINRVLIVDFDLHHGNGTQAIFYDNPAVLYFSTHQSPLYPGTGQVQETGSGAGLGYTVNIPLPPGAGDQAFDVAYGRVLPAVARRFRPELILVSAGYDAHWSDPLGSLQASLVALAAASRQIVALAQELCAGRLVFALEGGYSLEALAYGVANSLLALLGDSTVLDPLGPAARPERPAQAVFERVRAVHGLGG